jgi:xanthine dehydrogenase accessory factor
MHEVIDAVRAWFAAGKRVALATLVSTEGSSPRDPGAMFAISDSRDLAGAISGGCVESDLVSAAESIFAGGAAQTFVFGPGDELDGGPTCGGTLHVVIRELDRATFDAFAAAEAGEAPFALTLTLDAPYTIRVLSNDEAIAGCDERTFVERFGPKPRLYIVGAGDVTRPLVTYAATIGYRVTIVDPRSAFAVASRFPGAEMVVEWPDEAFAHLPIDERTAIVSLVHDPKFDLPTIATALRSPAGYIGAMGSRGTTARRETALREAGFGDEELARLHAPIGLDIGSRSPEEIALSIVAEIVASRRGGAGTSLKGTSGPLRSRVLANA